jgi:FkbM family methyltransferase
MTEKTVAANQSIEANGASSAATSEVTPPPSKRWFFPNKYRFISFSQVKEDWILYNAFGGKQNGFYVDVGAADPHLLSVTKLFYHMGWSGINIEPRPEAFAKLQAARPRDINLNLGCSDKEGELEFAIYGDLSSCDPEAIALLRQRGHDFTIAKTKVLTLTEILKRYLPTQNQTIDFCKIDVEGFERSVLLGLDFSQYRPAVFCVESTIPSSNTPCHKKFEDILVSAGYKIAYIYSINRYYVDMRRADAEQIAERFLGIAWGTKIIELNKIGYTLRKPRRIFRAIKRSIRASLYGAKDMWGWLTDRG